LGEANFGGTAPGEREGFCSGGEDHAGVDVSVEEDSVACGEESLDFISRGGRLVGMVGG